MFLLFFYFIMSREEKTHHENPILFFPILEKRLEEKKAV